MGKQFTAAPILMLAEKRRLNLNDKITKWLSEGVLRSCES
jgi:CubicO group peptidase (beta-lactamase class C family)